MHNTTSVSDEVMSFVSVDLDCRKSYVISICMLCNVQNLCSNVEVYAVSLGALLGFLRAADDDQLLNSSAGSAALAKMTVMIITNPTIIDGSAIEIGRAHV